MDIDEVVENLFDGMEATPEQREAARQALENLHRIKKWSYEQIDDWCWTDSDRAFDYIFG